MSDQVVHVPERSRFVLERDGEVIGKALYQREPGVITFTHTEVDPAFEGQGVGSAIARFALDQLRADGTRKALPVCPFIKGWIQRHPEYADMLYG